MKTGIIAAGLLAIGVALVPATVPVSASQVTESSTGADTATATPSPVPTPTDPVRAAEYWLRDYGIDRAWQVTRGKGMRIAIIDTGIGRGPVEFDGAVAAGTDMSGVGAADGRLPVGAVDGNHGSWVASLAAARGTGEGTGMVGVAPEAELLSVSVGFGSVSRVPFTEQIAEGIRWSVDNGADVINLSFTSNTPDWGVDWDEAFQYAFDNDVVIVVAAGNRGAGTSRVGAPATIPGVLTVGGVDPEGHVSLEASTQGITIGVSAPSEQLLGVSADGRIVTWDGTSGAAPIVAGVVALVRAAHPELDAANVINRIIRTATSPPGVSRLPDPEYGYGLLDAAAAVSASVPTVSQNPMGNLEEWIRLHRRADVDPTPQPSDGAVEVPPLPPADVATGQGSPLLPSRESLVYGTLPMFVFTTAAILVGLGVTAAVRRIRSAPRTPSRRHQEYFPP